MWRTFKRWLQIDTVEKLKQENEMLKVKLEEKQKAINKTNAYWKGVIYKMKSNNKNVA
jgi:hypothetical protein